MFQNLVISHNKEILFFFKSKYKISTGNKLEKTDGEKSVWDYFVSAVLHSKSKLYFLKVSTIFCNFVREGVKKKLII